MPADDEMSLVARIYDALERGDLAASLDLLDPEIEWHGPAALEERRGTLRGHEEVLAGILVHLPRSRDLRIEPEEMLQAGSTVVVLGHHRGRSPADGRRFAVPFAHVWSMDLGYAVRFRGYLDRERLARCLLGEAPLPPRREVPGHARAMAS
jgi:ketosteroid isomerase-like protein